MRTETRTFAGTAHQAGIAILLAIALTCSLAVGAPAAEPPVLKSGLWELSRSTEQQPEPKGLTTMCLDESVQSQMREFGLGVAKELCTKSDRRLEGNRLTIDAVCKLGQTTMTTHSATVFSGNTAYRTEGSATYDPPLMNMTQAKTTVDAKWVGECKPGQKPGDITLESGETINIKTMIRR